MGLSSITALRGVGVTWREVHDRYIIESSQKTSFSIGQRPCGLHIGCSDSHRPVQSASRPRELKSAYATSRSTRQMQHSWESEKPPKA